MKNLRLLLVIVLLLLSTGCVRMEPTEAGVRFLSLPPILGGGVSENTIAPGERVMLWPWEQVYRYSIAAQDITWSPRRGESGEGFLYTRAKDGNEVALSVTVTYQLQHDPAKLRYLAERVAVDDEGVRDIVYTVARSDIRTAMNELGTFEFRQVKAREGAIARSQEMMNQRLAPYGIEVQMVTLNDFQFARRGADGQPITTYQDKINLIQQIVEDTKRELSKRDTVEQEKLKELQAEQGNFERKVAEAQGYVEQAKKRGDAYFESRSNEGQAILARGKAEVEGITEKIQALSGPGGAAILKLEIAKELIKSDPRFVVMNQGRGGGQLDVSRTDTNELLRQSGIFEALRDRSPQHKESPAHTESTQSAGAR